MRNKGFTLMELIVVITILGILAVTAAPRFLNLSTDAKMRALEQIEVSVRTANDLIYMKSQMPSYSTKPVNNRNDLLDVDLDGDGVFEIRLKWNYLDNTDIEKRIDFSEDVFTVEYEGIYHTYIGYDKDYDLEVKDDNCYFKYTQAQSETESPIYELMTTSC